MDTRRSPLPWLIVFLLLGAVTAPAVAGRYLGKPFPDFEATDAVTGKKFSLEDFRGKVVLIDFWATWCGPCVKELPNVQRAYREYKDRGFEIISVSLDSKRQKFEQFVKQRRMTWPQVMEGGGWETRLAKKYGIRSIPAMFIIDQDGVCVSESARGRALQQTIAKTLGDAPSSGASSDRKPAPASRGRARPSLDAASATAIQGNLTSARDALESDLAPLPALGEQLDFVSREIDYIADQFPSPRKPESVRRRYERLHGDLGEMRQQMFLCGMLNTRIVRLPANPFAVEPEESIAMAEAREELINARMAAASLGLAISEVQAERTEIETAIKGIEREVRRGSGDAGTLVAQSAELSARANALRERFDAAWRRQLGETDEVLARYTTALAKERAPLEKARSLIESCRDRLATAGSGSVAGLALERDFGTLCGRLATIRDELAGLPVPGAADVVVPDNPFDGGRLADVRTRVEAGRRLDEAATAAAGLGDAMTAAERRAAALGAEVGRMQAALAAAGSEGERLQQLEREFSDLAARLLSFLDGA